MAEALGLYWLAPVLAAPLIGSFLGTLIQRLPAGRKVVFGRSSCPHCHHLLGLRDLVPILSWLVSRGRCRYCGARLGLFYPAIELAAIVVALWAVALLSGWLVWASCALGWTLLALVVIDQHHFTLPDALTLPLVPAGLAVAYLAAPDSLIDHGIGAAAGFAAFLLMGWAYRALRGREGLGLGDAKLLAAAGAWVAWQGLPGVVLLAAAAALAVVLVQSLAGRRLTLTSRVAFGPYLCFGTWLVWLYGPLVFP